MNPAQRYASLAKRLLGDDGAASVRGPKRGFGSGTLKVDRKIFAMLVDDRLVVKLPAGRVGELIASGAGEPFDGGKGRPMKEWVSVDPAAQWLPLAKEAMAFVRGR